MNVYNFFIDTPFEKKIYLLMLIIIIKYIKRFIYLLLYIPMDVVDQPGCSALPNTFYDSGRGNT